MNITVDGPCGSGKSTVAKLVAKKLNISYLDTGAMYRALGYYMIKNGVDIADEKSVLPELGSIEMNLWEENGVMQVSVNGENVTSHIREHEISMAASTISKIHAVRLKMVDLQRQIAKKSDCIMDGRDCGSFILPTAEYKFYMTASADIRAQRRRNELKGKGIDIPFETIKSDIEMRDKQDMTRDFAPLVVPENAIIIDTSLMNIEEVVDKILGYICR